MRKPTRLKLMLTGLVALPVALPTVLTAIDETMRGHGAASYENVYGLPIPYVASLVSFAVLVLALLGALIARVLVPWWRDRRDPTARVRTINAARSRPDDAGD